MHTNVRKCKICKTNIQETENPARAFLCYKSHLQCAGCNNLHQKICGVCGEMTFAVIVNGDEIDEAPYEQMVYEVVGQPQLEGFQNKAIQTDSVQLKSSDLVGVERVGAEPEETEQKEADPDEVGTEEGEQLGEEAIHKWNHKCKLCKTHIQEAENPARAFLCYKSHLQCAGCNNLHQKICGVCGEMTFAVIVNGDEIDEAPYEQMVYEVVGQPQLEGFQDKAIQTDSVQLKSSELVGVERVGAEPEETEQEEADPVEADTEEGEQLREEPIHKRNHKCKICKTHIQEAENPARAFLCYKSHLQCAGCNNLHQKICGVCGEMTFAVIANGISLS